jgi:hypothetical protein
MNRPIKINVQNDLLINWIAIDDTTGDFTYITNRAPTMKTTTSFHQIIPPIPLNKINRNKLH